MGHHGHLKEAHREFKEFPLILKVTPRGHPMCKMADVSLKMKPGALLEAVKMPHGPCRNALRRTYFPQGP